jgi:hypothetical protein
MSRNDSQTPLGNLYVRSQVVATGYSSVFEAIRADVHWRPALTDDAGRCLTPLECAMNLKATTNVLDAKAKGFGVEMLLERAGYEANTRIAPSNSPQIIAQRSERRREEAVG